MSKRTLAIVGNPNSGKTALFNHLSGLRQRTGNLAGVTVEQKIAEVTLGTANFELVDLPGTYSLYPLTEDEHVVTRVLLDPTAKGHPDAILYIADINNLERHLLLYTQIRDLGFPVLLGLSMSDVADEKGIELNTSELSKELGHELCEFSVRTGKGLPELKNKVLSLLENQKTSQPFYALNDVENKIIAPIKRNGYTDYARLLCAHHTVELGLLSTEEVKSIEEIKASVEFDDLSHQVDETMARFDHLNTLLKRVLKDRNDYNNTRSLRFDKLLTHAIAGPLIFIFILFLIFQAIYSLAEAPMNWIESAFTYSSDLVSSVLPDSWLSSLITEGIIPGFAGVLVFIPQIAILFFLLGILEESGYLSRAIFLFDRFFQRLGMNGRSLVAMVSASACAIPAIMSTRSIKSTRERLITILLTPLVSCSARTPVYIVLIGFIISGDKLWGVISLQGLAFLSFYLLGIIAIIVIAFLLKLIFPTDEQSYLMLEMPEYKWPSLKDISLFTWLKIRSFIVEAGKIIFIISLVLWFLASYGPSGREEMVEQELTELSNESVMTAEEEATIRNAKMLEASYAGKMGKWIEPVIEPLGFDWKIGIALVTSFAAREVFVSTMATIYAIGSEDDTKGIRQKMSAEVSPATGKKIYTRATALSLVVFYIFAMQCMSTLAVVRKETGTWKWPIAQFVFMTALAYLAAFAVFQLLS